MDRIAEVRALAQTIVDKYDMQATGISHYPGCWKIHMYCFAQVILASTTGDQPT